MTVVDKLELSEVKTKKLGSVLKALKAEEKTLVVDQLENRTLRLSIRNMKTNQFLPPQGVNVYDLLRHRHVVVSQDAAKALEARCLEQGS